MRNKILIAVSLVIVAVGGFFALRPPTAEPDQPEVAVRDGVGRQAESTPAPALSEVDDGPSRSAPARVTEASAPMAASGNLPKDHPWFGQLAGVTGRLVEEDGTPVTEMRVELIEVDMTALMKESFAPRSLESPDIDETFTDADGRFVLQGARQGAYHALNIGRGTGRATLRIVEQSLEHGELTDLGDIVLPAFGTIIGKIIDEDGEPVPGARVRAAPVPSIVMEVGILDVREGVAAAVKDDSDGDSVGAPSAMVFEVPRRVFTYLDRLPVPMTMTAEDGSFRLEGVTPGVVSGGGDKAGHVSGIFGPVTLSAGQEFDVGEVELTFGREVSGRVTDGAGNPVAGAEVLVGALLTVAPVAIMHPAGTTDDDGYYSIEGIRETGQLMATARRKRADAWVTAEAPGLSETIDIDLPTAQPVTLRVNDEEGEPVAGAEIRVRSADMSGDMFGAMLAMEVMGGEGTKKTTTVEGEPGVYTVQDITYGRWQFEVKADGCAPVYTEVEHRSEGTSATVVVARGRSLRLTAVDGETKEPIRAVHATLIGPKGPMFDAYAAAFTDDVGVAELGPLSPTWYEDMTEGSQSFFRGATIVAEHPRYGKGVVKLDADSSDVVVEMPPACTVTGRVHWAGENPPALYMLVLRNTARGPDAAVTQAFAPPRTSLTNIEGRFSFKGVAPGEYKILIMERYLEGDPIGLIVSQKEPNVLDDRSVTVAVGEENFVDVALTPDGQVEGGTFVGRITSSGSPLAGLEVRVGGGDDADTYTTDGRGEFRTDPYPVMDRVRIRISGEIPMGDGTVEDRVVFQERRRPTSGVETRIDIDLQLQKLVVQVVDARTGDPMPEVKASLGSGRGWRRRSNTMDTTDASGRVAVFLPDEKDYTLTLEGDAVAKLTRPVSSRDIRGAEPHLTIEMQAAVVCKGTVVLPEGRRANRAWFQIMSIDEEDMTEGSGQWTQAKEEDLTFEVKGLMPGEYQARMWGGGGMIVTTFDLGMNGDDRVVLDFANPTPPR